MAGTVVLDYGIARPQRLVQALAAVGVEAWLTASVDDIRTADRLVLPDADDDDETLKNGVADGMMERVQRHINQGKPLLCTGFATQLLLGGSTHAAMPRGLNIFRAPVNKFDPRMVDEYERPLKTPHVGFSFVVGLDRHPALSKLVPEASEGVWLYFRHRLCAPARVPFSEVAVAHHGVPFAGALWRDNILATQFLPELSGPLGLAILKAWVRSTEAPA